jgi:MFS family permease
VLQATGEATDLGIVLFARQTVETVLLLGGGVLADRIDRRFVMVGGSLASCISEAAIGTLFLTHTANLLLLCVFAMIDGVGDALFFPASAGLTPSTVDAEHLQKANSLIGFARNAIGAPLPAVLVTACLWDIGVEVFGILWITTMQREIPPDLLSRVSSCDALGSLIFTPIGLAVAAPVAIAVGLSGAFWIAAGRLAVPTLLILGLGDVRRMRAPDRLSARSSS